MAFRPADTIGAALAAGLCLTLAACGGAPEEPAGPAPAASGERYTVRSATIADLKPVAAVVSTRDMAEARTRIGGVLVELSVKEGDTVRRGQRIGRVVDDRLGLQTRAYDAQAAAAQAENARAQAELGRTRDLFEKGVYAKARMEQVQAAADAAAANLRAAQAQRAASAEMGAQGAILAPAAGKVLSAPVPPGSVVAPGQSIATITAGEPLLRLDLPEAQARQLKPGQSIPLEPQDVGGAAVGTVQQVYPSVEGGRVRVDVAAPGLSGALVGQRVRVRAPVGERQAVVVPARFVISRYGVDYVRLAGPDRTAAEIPVQLAGPAVGGQVEVLSGLKAGDVIVAPAEPGR